MVNIIYFLWKFLNLLIEIGVSSSILLNTSSHPCLIEFAFCTHMIKYVTVYCGRVEQVSVLSSRIEVLRPFILGYFLGWPLWDTQSNLHFFFIFWKRVGNFFTIPKRYWILRPHLRRNHQAPMHQALFLILLCFSKSTCHKIQQHTVRNISMLQNYCILLFTKVSPKSPKT